MINVRTVRIGSRGSALARWQTDYVAGLLRDAYPGLDVQIEIFTTKGDRVLDTPLPLIGGKGLFTAELEAALHEGRIDLAVHSLKDLPTENPPGLTVGANPPRASVQDVLVSRNGHTLDSLPAGATVGTSSRRRAAQLLSYRADFQTADIRGNVDTRVRKAHDPAGPYDAIVLAQAGLERLDRGEAISAVLPVDVMLPAPGQGALGIQCRDEDASLELLAALNHAETQAAVIAERAFLAGLGGGCSVPIAAYATVENGTLHLHGRVSALDGSQQIDVRRSTADGLDLSAAQALGDEAAQEALAQGARALLDAAP